MILLLGGENGPMHYQNIEKPRGPHKCLDASPVRATQILCKLKQ